MPPSKHLPYLEILRSITFHLVWTHPYPHFLSPCPSCLVPLVSSDYLRFVLISQVTYQVLFFSFISLPLTQRVVSLSSIFLFDLSIRSLFLSSHLIFPSISHHQGTFILLYLFLWCYFTLAYLSSDYILSGFICLKLSCLCNLYRFGTIITTSWFKELLWSSFAGIETLNNSDFVISCLVITKFIW